MAIFMMETPWPEGGSPAHEDILIDWLRKEPIVRQCALDLLDKNPGDLRYVWFAQYLWDILYGAGCPYAQDWLRQKTADHLRLNFASIDFKRIAEILEGGRYFR